jgi:hypothetical protein
MKYLKAALLAVAMSTVAPGALMAGRLRAPEVPPNETDTPAPIDAGAPQGPLAISPLAISNAPTAPDAKAKGVFGPAQPWPIVAIHAALLPDGRVISFGTGTGGYQGGYTFDVWTPGSDNHLTMPQGTGYDVFCAGQTVLSDGRMLTVGGDLTINGQRNWSNDSSTLFSPATNSVVAGPTMFYARWYPTVVPLTNGEQLVLGGREEGPVDPQVPAVVPEVFNFTTGWRTLTGATSDPAFGLTKNNWYYPRSWLLPRGNVLVVGNDGQMWSVGTGGLGTITTLPSTTRAGTYAFPSAMYRPGKILSLRNNSAYTIDATGAVPTSAATQPPSDQDRIWATLTVLADGNVLLTGGSGVSNQLTNVAYTAETWHPGTGAWTTGAAMTKARLYHSTAILLPDATVLVAGGGAPGPVRQMNAEVYYPGYLYTATGQLAPRPTISGAPKALVAGQQFSVTVGATDVISKVALIHTSADTHSFDAGQRFVQLGFTQSGTTVTATVPGNANIVPPGWYLLFVVRNTGVPSTGSMVHVG